MVTQTVPFPDGKLESGVAFWSKAFRFVAVFMVLFIGIQVATCELPGSDCAIVFAADHDVAISSSAGASAVGLPVDHRSVPDKDCDNCICCCAHSRVEAQISLVPGETQQIDCVELVVLNPVSRPFVIERPPQLS